MRKYKKYVVGFDGDKQVIYGSDNLDSATYIDAMGIKEAIKKQKKLIEYNNPYKHPKVVLYELVPIKIEGKKWK